MHSEAGMLRKNTKSHDTCDNSAVFQIYKIKMKATYSWSALHSPMNQNCLWFYKYLVNYNTN